MKEIWFTADLHLGHANIIKYSNRPFDNVDEMDAQLIDNWNKNVKEKDDVYCLGDMFLCDVDTANNILDRLNGTIHYIWGNHDKTAQRCKKRFAWTKDMYDLKVSDPTAKHNKRNIVMCHYAMRVWNKSHHGAYHAFGHSHGSLFEPEDSFSMDVGVDAIAKRLSGKPEDYRPINLDEFNSFMSQRHFRPIDHHGASNDS